MRRQRAWASASLPSTASTPTSKPRSFEVEVGLACDRGPAEVGDDGADQLGDAALERGVRLAVDQAAEAAQADGDRLPHGQIALVSERFDEGEEVGRASRPAITAFQASSTRL